MKKANGILFRCKAKWQIEGERNTAYFFSLEKNKYNAKTCCSLVKEDGTVVRNPKTILTLQKQFYQKLYRKDHTIKFKTSEYTRTNNQRTRTFNL